MKTDTIETKTINVTKLLDIMANSTIDEMLEKYKDWEDELEDDTEHDPDFVYPRLCMTRKQSKVLLYNKFVELVQEFSK